jgi:hypothetical protein
MSSLEHQAQRTHVFIVSRIFGELFVAASSSAPNWSVSNMTVELAAKRATHGWLRCLNDWFVAGHCYSPAGNITRFNGCEHHIDGRKFAW